MEDTFTKKHLSHFYKEVSFFLIPYLVLLAGCLTIKVIYTREEIYFFINKLHTPWGDKVFPFFTFLGDGVALVVFALIIGLFSYRRSFLLLTGYFMTAIVAQILKFIFDMPRPYLYFETMRGSIHYVEGITMLSAHSFPSGHTTTAFSACITMAYIFRKNYLDVLTLILAACIGYSRMYLSQHFFEDVMAGSAIGVFVTMFWLYWLDNKEFLYKGAWRGGLLKKAE
ncbi:phosphatase PAP2 family protein [Mucilaginibacter myungsuensis]|uniref:Phosphatase PAP2 family protein n=1 Tax=Mucilaginibacter myungsuensis TaxID=649104 RepID=A0A929L0H4_9SPHI|nr:phosphatase PAP2 family protein [Mucilaginibacter myungsuensis]MBE9663992.1 phosphatase PAP2 family protein [Mucilaginibacter myungsuensis]MDN3601171.1 phosphatase PAP2 family protein [Mucilaginibacter myungsuensis]